MKKILLLVSGLIYLSVLQSQPNRLSEQAGKIISNKKIPSGYEFQLSNAFARVTAYNATTIRIRVTRQKMTDDFSVAIDDLLPKGKLSDIKMSGNTYSLNTDSLTININADPFRVSVSNNRGEDLCSDEPALGISWFGNQVSCYKKMYADEKFIGLGEKTGDLNRRGNFYQNWNSDVPGYSLIQDPLYSTIPFFIGVHGKAMYGIFFDNTHKSYFNFGGGADEELFHFGADDGEMNYYFFGGSSVQQIIKDYTSLTGRTPMPPLWSLGFQQSRYGYNSQKQLLDVAKSFREKQLPADAIVSDINYMDNYKVFTWSDKYPDVKGMMDQMKQMGFDVVTIIDPGIKVEKGYKQYDEGVANSYFAKYPDGRFYIGHVWPGRCHFPDFTKPAAVAWWGKSFKDAYVANGIRGFWNDMNEPAAWGREFPNLIEFGDGKDKKTLFTVKNTYGLLMARATFLGTKDLLNGQRPFVLTRAAYSGVQKYSAQWTGDNVASDDHMLLGFRLLNSMGLSGVPFVGTDIGGFIGNPTAELFIRWMSLGTYSPFFRNHTAIDNNYREPWLFNDVNTDKIRKILELRYQLMPYLYSSFYEAHTSGMPINRMLPIDYTFDDSVYDGKFKNQFLFGDNMLVCPVASTQNIAEVYLPGNESWYRFSNDTKIYQGGQSVYVASPLEDLPVFVKAGAIIPMQSVVQNTKEKGDGILYLHAWKGKSKTVFTYYEDDGNTYNYEKGDYCKREIVYDPAAATVTVGKKEGSYTSKFNKVKLILHGFGKASGKTVDLSNDATTINIQ
jgi:alpha-glucosidase